MRPYRQSFTHKATCFVFLTGIGALFYVSSSLASGFSVSESAVVESPAEVQPSFAKARVFGWNLFQGDFKRVKDPWFNPSYRIHIGDVVSIRFWGALEFAEEIPVDSRGHIFLPKVGNIKVVGVKNSEIVDVVRSKVRTVYKEKVHVYANVGSYQPITVFVTGNVNKPGLYKGMSSDSLLQFIDKARGIQPECGSYRDITILREGKPVACADLYAFLTQGALEPFQFKGGDVISVGDVKNRITFSGDVKRPYRFEFASESLQLSDAMNLSLPNPTATTVTITRWLPNNKKTVKALSVEAADGVELFSGDLVEVSSDHISDVNVVTIEGEHEGTRTLLVKRGESLGGIMDRLVFTPRSRPGAIQLFRKSVAKAQKQFLEARLKKLEEQVLTTPSITKEESLIRAQESKGILAFVDRARKVEPKGQIVINEKTDPKDIYLEDGDRVFIPAQSGLVLVQGEVAFPGAHTFVKGMTAGAYIRLAGEMTERANPENVLVVHPNGRVERFESERELNKMKPVSGDAVFVLPKMGGKNLQIAKDVTQILYQVAVSAGVLVAL
ncbi:MAG: polysaccharide export protein [Desulfobacterales bacterium]|nr:polysaccharide export protein [Desulfobacterales bacterium]